MALFNYATKEITLKIVYYGPGLSGKTTNLQYLHTILNPATKGRLLSLSTESDRTLFFDFLPIELGKIRDFSIRFQLYTVPGQVRYNATRKVVLKGGDGVVFVADSQNDMREQNVESFENMRENLLANNINPDEIPIVLQYNKRDLKNVASLDELNADLNIGNYPVIEASAIDGTGVEDSFKLITKLLLKYISRKHNIEIQPAKEPQVVAQELSSKAEEVAPEIFDLPSPVTETPVLGPEEIPMPSHLAEAAEVMSVEDIPSYTDRDHKNKPAAEVEREKVAVTEISEGRVFPAEKVEVLPVEHIPSFTDQDFKNKPAAEVEREKVAVTEIREVPVFSAERVDRIIDEIAKISGVLTDLKNSVYVLSKEMKDLREVRKEQEETNRILRGIAQLFEAMREKKGWFRF